MTRLAGLATAGVALLVALACSPATTALEEPEPTMSHSDTPEPPPEPSTTKPVPSRDTSADEQEVRAVAESYVRAVTARDEPTAARYTCRKRDGSLLWVSAAGRPITVLRVEISPHQLPGGVPVAFVDIEADGKPKSGLLLEKRDGRWCVWP